MNTTEKREPTSPFRAGDGCTYTIGTDEYPCTVVRVSPTGHRVDVVMDRALIRGHHEVAQEDQFEVDGVLFQVGNGPPRTFTRRSTGDATAPRWTWIEKGHRYGHLTLGRSHYLDPSF